jgi:uncharacterized protein YfbU (UPF0304 family)
MMAKDISIYDAKCVRDIYNIIKKNYNFNMNDFKIAEAPVCVFDDFNRDLQKSSNKYLNFERFLIDVKFSNLMKF